MACIPVSLIVAKVAFSVVVFDGSISNSCLFKCLKKKSELLVTPTVFLIFPFIP